MEQRTLEGVGRRLDDAIETLETLEQSLEPSVPQDFDRADVEFVGIYYHHLWQVTLGMLAVEQVTEAQSTAFRAIFGERIDVSEMRRLRRGGEFDLAIAAFADFIHWIIIFEGSLVAFDSEASRLQGMSLELVAVFESVISELFLVSTDDISWRNHRFARTLEALRKVLSTRWGTTRPFLTGGATGTEVTLLGREGIGYFPEFFLLRSTSSSIARSRFASPWFGSSSRIRR